MADIVLQARPAFGPLLRSVGSAPAGIAATERLGLGLATIHAFRDRGPALRDRIREAFGVALPEGPRRETAGDLAGGLAFLGTAPDAWLAVREGGDDVAGMLAGSLEGLAAVADQSDGYAVLRLAGAAVPRALAKGMSLDLDPGLFRPGDVAVSSAAHIGVTLWRLPDGPNGEPVYEVAVARSYAESFWHWFSSSAAEFGLRHAPEER